MPAGDRKLTMDELGRIPAGEYASSVAGGLCLVLDNVRSRMNVGSIFRTADAFGVERLVLAGFTPRPPHREIEKTALGATVSVPWTGSEDTLSAVQALQRDGWTVYAVEQTRQALPFTELDPAPADRIALVFGNELQGVADSVVQACDGCLVVPQQGSKHSLNIAVCAGILAWWCAPARRQPQ